MKDYTRELKQKATRDSLVLGGDIFIINELKQAGFYESDIHDLNHMINVWKARETFAKTAAQKSIIKVMLEKIKNTSVCTGCKYASACYDPDRKQLCLGYELKRG